RAVSEPPGPAQRERPVVTGHASWRWPPALRLGSVVGDHGHGRPPSRPHPAGYALATAVRPRANAECASAGLAVWLIGHDGRATARPLASMRHHTHTTVPTPAAANRTALGQGPSNSRAATTTRPTRVPMRRPRWRPGRP